MNNIKLRRLVIFTGVGLVLLAVTIVGTQWFQSHPLIDISTDSTPLNIQIGTSSFVLNSSHRSIRLAKGTYNYRATYGEGGDKISLYGTVDSLASVVPKIVVSYKIFSNESIKQALCLSEGLQQPSDCGSRYTPQKVTFVADHTWAIVNYTPSDELGPSLFILQLSNGSWQKVAGPVASPKDLQGLVPLTVLAAIQ